MSHEEEPLDDDDPRRETLSRIVDIGLIAALLAVIFVIGPLARSFFYGAELWFVIPSIIYLVWLFFRNRRSRRTQ